MHMHFGLSAVVIITVSSLEKLKTNIIIIIVKIMKHHTSVYVVEHMSYRIN